MDSVDPSIALQAGRNLPQFGPDYNALAQMQRTQIAVQQARTVQEAQNALKSLYANPQNFDAKTLQPTPEAFAQLARLAPNAAFDVRNNLVTLQNAQLRNQHMQSEITKDTFDQAMKIGKDADDEYTSALRKGVPQPEAQRIAQDKYTKDLDAFKASGLPDSMKSRLNPNFDHVRIQQNQMTIAQQMAAQQHERTEARADRAEVRADKTDMRADQSSALAAEKAGEPKFVGSVTSDGKRQENVPLRAGGPTGWMDAQGTPVPQGAVSNVHHMGTKGDDDAATAGQPTGPTDLHGQEYLDKLPSSRSAMIKGYAEGRVAFPGSFSLRSPYWQKMVADITQYDPDFDAVNYNARASARKDFTSGKSAQNITSFNTAIGHLGSLNSAVDKLNNSDYPWWNRASNWANVQGGNTRFQAAQKAFETARTAVSDELERAFRGTGGNVTGIEQWRKNLDSADSPTALHTAVKEAVNLLRSRIDSVGEQYKRGMGTTADVMDLLTPSAKKTLASLPGGEDLARDTETSIPPKGGAASAPAASAASAAIPPTGGQSEAPTPQQQAAPTPLPNGAKIYMGAAQADNLKKWNEAKPGTQFILQDGSVAIKP